MTLEELYKVNRDLYVKKYTMKTGSVDDAEDIVQEAFMRALQYWESFDENQKDLSVWFSTILHNCWRDYQRDKRDQGIVRDDVNNLEEVGYSNTLAENMTLIDKLMRTKTEGRQEVLHLHYHLGYTSKEISQITDHPYASIRVYLSEFKKEVQEMFN